MQQRLDKPPGHDERMNSRQAMDTHGSGAHARLRHHLLVPSQYRSGRPWVRGKKWYDPSQRGIARTPDPSFIKEIKRIISITIMVNACVSHFIEAQILEAIGVDYIDDNEAIALADEDNFINKHNFLCPFVCGCENYGEALSRVKEGAAMIRIQGDLFGSGNVAKTIKNMRVVMG
ncbi:hypothetical protein SO802_026033 [Lithocarpus litseifolius]|uniref:PdxS/SNZ N-terminal domain-containing protein n=1 Tax=Lithocarpus litseifolius TaxID=425828 RepID=A0AAW2C019_9ROSI